MRGQKVIVKAYGNVPILRRIWDATDKTVYVLEENEYHKLIAGSKAYDPVGFPVKDIFEYNDNVKITETLDWSVLLRWKH